MKIDLDELERKVRKFYDGNSDEWELSGRQMLALIARIRELEAAGRVLEERARYGIDDDRKLAEFDAALEILEKGVVLP